jgi:hypothetical protein
LEQAVSGERVLEVATDWKRRDLSGERLGGGDGLPAQAKGKLERAPKFDEFIRDVTWTYSK